MWIRVFFNSMGGLALLLLGTAVGAAGRADRDQPMNIAADSLRYDQNTQTSVFTGNVQVHKGSIVMRGVRLQVSQDAAGEQKGQLDGGAGNLAYFRQQRAVAGEEFVEAQADTITYDSKAALVTLTGHAIFKRLQGERVTDTVTGQIIHYHNDTDVFTVNDGGSAAPNAGGSAAGASSAINGRVHVTLTARKTLPAPAAASSAAASSPASSAASSAAPLRPSLQLKSGAQP